MTPRLPAIPAPGADPTEAAAFWMARLRSEPTQEEREAFSQWLEKPENSASYQRLQRIWALAGTAIESPVVERLRPQKKAPAFAWWMAAAAGLLVAILSGTVYVASLPQQGLGSPSAGQQIAAQQRDFTTATGETKNVRLPDGSTVVLDTASAVRVAYTAAERRVDLIRGQAIFTVAKHQPHPFVVHVADHRVIATGTIFDVRAKAEHVEVTLLEGHVVVLQGSLQGQKGRTELNPGQQLVARAGDAGTVKAVDVDQITAWRTGHLVFVNQRLDDAVEDINRYSNTQIVLNDPELAELRISGVFVTGRTMDIVTALERLYPIASQHDAAGRVILSRAPSSHEN